MEIKKFFEEHSSVAVAFSGGTDSSVLLMLAKKYAKHVKAYYVKSQFQPEFEYADAVSVAKQLGAELEVIPLDVLSDTVVVSNPENRCYYCKKNVFTAICNAAQRDGLSTVVDGTNASDDISDRPGMKALEELGVLSPLRMCGYTKAYIRSLAKEGELPVSDKPSYACLATRIPAGTPISIELLKKTENAENAMRCLGFTNFRVRYFNQNAKLELCKKDFDLLYKNRERVYALLSDYYGDVYLDLKERADE